MSANYKGENEVKQGAEHRSDIYFMAEERLMKAMGPVIASNGVHYLQMRLVGSHSTSGREKKGNKEMTGQGSGLRP